MNHSYTWVSDAVSADAVSTRAFLQQAVDHYPRLAAFSFMLKLPYRETLADYRSLLQRFHTEVWQRTGEYSRERQQPRRASPPTVLRWVWESTSSPECKTVLLMNLNTLGTVQNPLPGGSVLQQMEVIVSDAWRTVSEANTRVTSMSSFIVSRSDRSAFTQTFDQLRTRVDKMTCPVVTARTGVICP
ncbi:TPA: DUF3296 domain-containing protein [Klebsiella aerogenes]